MGGLFGRVVFTVLLGIILVTTAWLSFSRFVQGRSLRVPDLRNLTLEEAQAVVNERGLLLVPERARDSYDDEIPVRRVRDQNPSPFTDVKSGQGVRVSLSLGPRMIRVPELTGMTSRTAALSLSRSGLKEGSLSSARIASPVAGVVALGIVPGTITTPETRVDVLINRGAPDVAYVMPDVIGRDFEKVRLAFEVRGFQIGSVRGQVYEGAASGTILRHSPQAGYPVTFRDRLSFVIAAPEGAEPIPASPS